MNSPNLVDYVAELNRRRIGRGLRAVAWDPAAARVAQRAADAMAVAGQVRHPNVGECVIAGASWFFQPFQLFELWESDFPHWAWLYSPTATRFGLAVAGSVRPDGRFYWAGVFDGFQAPADTPGAPPVNPGGPVVSGGGWWLNWARRWGLRR